MIKPIIRVEKCKEKGWESCCDLCGRRCFNKVAAHLELPGSYLDDLIFCLPCIKELRDQTDPLRVLVLTGEDTK